MLQQNTQEWLDFRKDKIGGSDAAVIMGISPWMTPHALWLEKMGLSHSKEMTAAMRRGHDLEEKARQFFEIESRIPIDPKVVLHPTIEWMMASIDGMSADRQTVVEIKCPGHTDHSLAKNGEIPAKYIPQLQHQMEVCQINHMFYLSFDGTEGVILPVERDDKYITRLIEVEQAFWDCMQEFRAPDLCDRDFELRDDDLWIRCAQEWRDTYEQLQYLQEREQLQREQLKAMSRGKNCLGGGIRLSKVVRKGNIDYGKIPELENVDLDLYRKPTSEFIKITATTPY